MNLLTIITVNKNSGNLFKRTSECMLEILKENENISWLIIDSMSIDESSEIISNIKKREFNKNIKKIIEKDFGIYNAMNKGIKFANSKFILFLNSGDEIYKKNLNFVINQSRNNNYNLICNFNILKNKKISIIFKKIVYFIQISLNLSLPSSHNAIIYLTENLKDLP